MACTPELYRFLVTRLREPVDYSYTVFGSDIPHKVCFTLAVSIGNRSWIGTSDTSYADAYNHADHAAVEAMLAYAGSESELREFLGLPPRVIDPELEAILDGLTEKELFEKCRVNVIEMDMSDYSVE